MTYRRPPLHNRMLILQQYETIQTELKNKEYNFEQKAFLIKEANRLLELLEHLQVEKRKRREANGNKPIGRPKKRVDSFGQPLYRESKVKKTEDLESKKKFLSEIQDEPTET
jgi:hypothetical protein